MRELGRAMEQVRTWAGYREGAVARLNDSIRRLYPDAPLRARRAGPVSEPRLLTDDRLIADVEAGRDTDADGKHWLALLGVLAPRPARRVSAVPLWFVRAYDDAFRADGYLVGLHRWAVAAQRDQRRLRSAAVADVSVGRLRERMLAGFADAPVEVREMLTGYIDDLVHQLDVPEVRRRHTGVQLVDDGSAAMPEGTVLPPGQFVTISWTFHNPGPGTWDDCVLARVDTEATGLVAPPFVPVPATAAGADVTVTCPVGAGDRCGTHRAHYKLVRRDGTWWTPTAFVGVFATIIVAPPELAATWHVWPTVVD